MQVGIHSCSPGHPSAGENREKRGLEGWGIPVFRRPDVKGNLYVQFTIQFPDSGFLEESQLKELEGLLPTRHDPPALEPEAEEVHGYDRVRDEDWAAFNSDTS
ncbi:dnaJ homolog subfamily A member 2-like [Halichondria panicea]|uniref:dnaJ homolog subfamily A member 2-like n=1 Tax=Halichondria panicea TaxID=6063 RepID=UPI00312B7DEB